MRFGSMAAMLVGLLSLFLLSGCKVDGTVTVQPQPANSQTANLSCAVTLSSGSSTTVTSGVAVPLTLQVTGGTAPYTYSGVSGTFSSSTTFSATFTNTGTTNQNTTQQFSISDSSGSSASCSLTVTVLPVTTTTPASTLACNMVSSPTNPKLNANVVFTATASGGTAPYTFQDFVPGVNSIIVSPLASTSSTTAAATAYYTATGLVTATVSVKDATNTTVSCSSVQNVRVFPNIVLAVSPATSVTNGNTMTVTATGMNFIATPSFTFTSTDSTVTVTPNGNSATIAANDNLSHVFNIVVTGTATSGGVTDTAQNSVQLSFVPRPMLNCYMTHTASSYQTGSTINYQIYSSTGEALTVTSFTPGTGGTMLSSSLSQYISASYSTTGTKVAGALARSTATGDLCNNGATIQDSVTINTVFSCSVVTNINPSTRNQKFTMTAQTSGATGTPFITGIYTSWDAVVGFGGYTSNTSAYITFYNAGVFPLTATVMDSSGRTATCTSYQTVYY